MVQDVLSRTLTVADPRAAAALIDPVSQGMVLAFAGRPRSLAEVARDLDVDIKRLHHHVLRFCRLGLLEVAETKARAGRPIKLYRTVAETFFVPHDAAPELYTERLARDLREGLRAAATRPGKGFLFYLGPDGVPRAQAARGDSAPEAMEAWRVLRLAPQDMADLTADLEALLNRYMARSGRGPAYLVHAAIAPHLTAEPAPEPTPAPPPVRAEPAAWSAKARIQIA
jgi:hypothetical protein